MIPKPALYLDENMQVGLAARLAAMGFDVLTARDAGMLGRNDEEHLILAARQNRALLTHDAQDFDAIAKRWTAAGQSHEG